MDITTGMLAMASNKELTTLPAVPCGGTAYFDVTSVLTTHMKNSVKGVIFCMLAGGRATASVKKAYMRSVIIIGEYLCT